MPVGERKFRGVQTLDKSGFAGILTDIVGRFCRVHIRHLATALKPHGAGPIGAEGNRPFRPQAVLLFLKSKKA